MLPRVNGDANKREETSKNEGDRRFSAGVLHSRAKNGRSRRARSFELALRGRRLEHSAVCRMLAVAVTTCMKGKALSTSRRDAGRAGLTLGTPPRLGAACSSSWRESSTARD